MNVAVPHPFIDAAAAKRSGPPSVPSAQSDQRADIEGWQILVVDDDDDVRETVGYALSDSGAAVTLAAHAQAAMDLITGGLLPDVIVLDLMMPVVSGWDVWDWLQASPARARIPVVVFTASAFGDGAIGQARVVHKGADLDALVQALVQAATDWR